MSTKELESKLQAIHESAVESRNAANDVLKKLSELRTWMTEEEIKRLKTQQANNPTSRH